MKTKKLVLSIDLQPYKGFFKDMIEKYTNEGYDFLCTHAGTAYFIREFVSSEDTGRD